MGAVGLFAEVVAWIGYAFAFIAGLGILGIVLWIADRRIHFLQNEDIPIIILIVAIALGIGLAIAVLN